MVSTMRFHRMNKGSIPLRSSIFGGIVEWHNVCLSRRSPQDQYLLLPPFQYLRASLIRLPNLQ